MENSSAEKTQIWNYAIQEHVKLSLTKQSIIDPILQMRVNLEQKYFMHFNFFLSKPINEIVYELTSRPVAQAFLDSRYASEDNEYLKREYHCKTEEGIEEINDRIRMLGEFYNANDRNGKSEYPMMIVTDTRSIFQKRQRRYKKICAGQGSSDQTEQKSQFYCYSFDTDNFLKDMSHISKMYNQQKNDKNDYSFDSDVHDVYLKQNNPYKKLHFVQEIRSQAQSPQNFWKTQTNLHHLVCDFQQKVGDIQPEKKKVTKDRQSFCSHFQKEGRKPLKSYDLKNLSLTKTNDENLKDFDQKKPNFLSSYLNLFQNKYRKLYLSNNHSILGNTDVITNADQNDNTQNIGLKQIDAMIDKQKEQKFKQRKKIRQKAQELLRRVRVSSQGQ